MRIISIVLLSLIFAGCGTMSVKTNNTAIETTSFNEIKEVVVVPVKVVVKESGIGSLEKLPEKSRIASMLVQEELGRILSENNGIKIIEYTPEDDDGIEKLDNYIGLYKRVAGAAEFASFNKGAWSHKTGSGFDYTLGSDITFIKEQTGADHAVFVYGEDIVTSAGVKTMGTLLLLAGVAVNPGGVAVLHLGIVDLNDGSLLWSNSIANQSMSLDDRESVYKSIHETLKDSPLVISQ